MCTQDQIAEKEFLRLADALEPPDQSQRDSGRRDGLPGIRRRDYNCDVTAESAEIEEFLLDRGAGQLAHPGGTLYEHLVRVAALLAGWGASDELQAAGLCHACYGTDGYPNTLLRLDERPVLTALVGARAESLVYMYASCDRAAVYSALEHPGPLSFRDRFTGLMHTPPEPDIRAFTELTAANKLDVIRHNALLAAQEGTAQQKFFAGVRARLTDAAWEAWDAWG
jgi:hypothetical protein